MPGYLPELATLLSKYHNKEDETLNVWNFEPVLSHRSASEFVGLKNAGATCYMNSIMQQLYMQPRARQVMFSLDDDDEEKYREKAQEAAAGSLDANATSTTSVVTTRAGSNTSNAGDADETAAADLSSMFYQMQRIFGSLG